MMVNFRRTWKFAAQPAVGFDGLNGPEVGPSFRFATARRLEYGRIMVTVGKKA
jgi:hypothetical protein